MPRPPAVSLAHPPPLGRTVASLGLGALNLLFFAELWPHTPAARPWLLGVGWLLLLTLPLQFVGWAWRWRRACAGPGWVRLLAVVGFWGGLAWDWLRGFCCWQMG